MSHKGLQSGHPTPRDDSARKQDCRISGKVDVDRVIEANISRGFINQYKAARNENTPRDNWRFFLEILTLIALLVYAALTAWQGCSSQKILDVTRDQFREATRPRVVIQGFRIANISGGEIGKPMAGKPVVADIVFKNIGKSVALRLTIHRHLLFSDSIDNFRLDAFGVQRQLQLGCRRHAEHQRGFAKGYLHKRQHYSN